MKFVSSYLDRFQRYDVLKNIQLLGHPVYCEIWLKFVKIFSSWATPHACTDGREFGVEELKVLHAKFHPPPSVNLIGVTPVGAKNLSIIPLTELNTAACASRSAGGNYRHRCEASL